MKPHKFSFDEHHVLHNLKHYLPAQAPLKDFIHHNTLHTFQNLRFHDALRNASELFGYKVSLSLDQFRNLYTTERIREDVLGKIIKDKKGIEYLKEWKGKVVSKLYNTSTIPRIGKLRSNWKRVYHTDLDSIVHPILFRLLCRAVGS